MEMIYYRLKGCVNGDNFHEDTIMRLNYKNHFINSYLNENQD